MPQYKCYQSLKRYKRKIYKEMFKILDSDERLEQKKAEQQFDTQTECDEIVALVNQSQYACVLCKKYKITKGMRRGKKTKKPDIGDDEYKPRKCQTLFAVIG